MKIKRKHIERIEISGLNNEREFAFDYVITNGFRVKLSGPSKGRSAMTYSKTRFLIIAEREVKSS